MFDALILTGLPMKSENFVIQKEREGTSGSLALAGNSEFKKRPKKEAALCVGSLDTLPRTSGGRGQ